MPGKNPLPFADFRPRGSEKLLRHIHKFNFFQTGGKKKKLFLLPRLVKPGNFISPISETSTRPGERTLLINGADEVPFRRRTNNGSRSCTVGETWILRRIAQKPRGSCLLNMGQVVSAPDH